MAVDSETLAAALQKRKAYIVERIDTITPKECWGLVERDLGLEKGTLKQQKELFKGLLDELLVAATPPPANKQKAKGEQQDTEKKEKQREKKRAARSAEDNEGAPAKKPAPKKTKKQAGAPVAAAPRKNITETSAGVEKLKQLCKAATIKIPPNVYRGAQGAGEVEARLEALLAKHGLGRGADPRELSAVARKLAKERDLDGMDASNILAEGGRRRRAAVPKIYTEPAVEDSSQEEEGGAASDAENVSPGNGNKGAKASGAAPAAAAGTPGQGQGSSPGGQQSSPEQDASSEESPESDRRKTTSETPFDPESGSDSPGASSEEEAASSDAGSEGESSEED